MERRNNSKEWIKSLKIAIINNDLNKIEEYSKRDIPQFSSIEKAQEALALITQAKTILENKKNEIAKIMQQLKQTKNFIQNTPSSAIFSKEG